MFFILSKLLAFLIKPMTWALALFLYSLVTGKPGRKKRAFAGGVLVLLFFSNAFILDEVMRQWEIPAVKTDSLPTYDAGIVLGGMISYDEKIDRLQFHRSGDRLMQAIELYKRGKIKKMVFTSGSGSILHPEKKEADFAQRFLRTIGMPEEDLLFENQSRNTGENALLTKPLLERNFPNGKFLLITSGFHMRRARNCFSDAGIQTDPFSTDRLSGPRKFEFDHLFIPNTEVLAGWEILLHEWIGWVTYEVRGYCRCK